jgi:hypothetical protein
MGHAPDDSSWDRPRLDPRMDYVWVMERMSELRIIS